MFINAQQLGQRAAEICNVVSKEPKRRYGQKLAEPKVATSGRREKDSAGEDMAQISKKRNPQCTQETGVPQKKKTSVALDARWTREISQENRLSVVHARSKGGDEKCTYEGSLKMAEEGFRAK